MDVKVLLTKFHYKKNYTPAEAVGGAFLYALLAFPSLVYLLTVKVRNFLYRKRILKTFRPHQYTISVGNLTTGGTGKTPITAEIANYFVKKGEYPAILSRGYGGELSNKNVNVISDGINLYYKADMSGDEPYWLAVNLNMCAVLTCSNRVKAAKYAIEKLGVTKIILDDAFQHRKIYRDLNIVLVDSEKMFGNENLLPAGPLREGLEGFGRIDRLVIVSKNIDHTRAEKIAKIMTKKQGIKSFVAKAEPDYVYNIVTGEHLEKDSEIIALSAIGQPEQFYAFLEKDYKIKDKISFDDHHLYIPEDIKDIEGNIVTTEKDAVKLALLNRTNIYALKLKTVLDVKFLLE